MNDFATVLKIIESILYSLSFEKRFMHGCELIGASISSENVHVVGLHDSGNIWSDSHPWKEVLEFIKNDPEHSKHYDMLEYNINELMEMTDGL